MRTLTNKRSSQTESAHIDLPPEYRFLRILGKGGTSEVSLVERVSDGRQFAYKYCFPPSDSAKANSEVVADFLQVARREIELTKHLNHPCVVPVSPISELAPQAGLIMPPILGKPLIEAKRPLPPEILREVISALSISLYFLELKSVVHGDIKPHNIFLPPEVLEGQHDFRRLFFPRLIDFSMGISANESVVDRLGMGTLGYGAPETLSQRRSTSEDSDPDKVRPDKSTRGSLTFQSDMFSLGVVAYYLACGRHPFIDSTEDPAAISAAVTEYSPPRLDKELAGFPTELGKLIDSMLAKEPALRPKNGYVLCKALEKQGASYPFRIAIQPRHLLPQTPEQDIEGLSTLPGLRLPARNYLHRISNGDISKIRLILDATFRKRQLVWSDGAICAASGFHSYLWPRRLRQWERDSFANLTLSEAKWVVRCAVVGGIAKLIRIIESPRNLRPGIANSSLVETVRDDLSKATIKTQSRILATKLEAKNPENKSLELLATLQLQAEQIADSAKNAFEYCEALKRDNRQIEALSLLRKLAKSAEKSNDTEILIETLHRDGDIRRDSGDMNGAETLYNRIIELSTTGDTLLLAETYKDLGDLYKLKQDFKAGLTALKNAERLYRKFDDTTELARVTNNMGNIHWIASQYRDALNCYRKALHLHRKRNDLNDISSTVNNIASIYAVTGRLERGIHIYLISLAMKRKLGNRPEIARTLNNLGYTYYMQGKLPEALEALKEALQINEVESSKKEIITNLDNFVSCAITAGRFSEALLHIRRGRELSEELHDAHSKAIFDASLARALLHTGQWDHALRLSLRSGASAQELSDKVLEVRSLLLQAELYSEMQIHNESSGCAERAAKLALEIGDKQAQIQCILVNDDSPKEQLAHALELALSSKSPRDIALCELALAEYCLAANEVSPAEDYLERAGKFFQHVAEDIDHIRFWRLWAEIKMLNSKITVAELRQVFDRLHAVGLKTRPQSERCESWKMEIVLAEVGSKCGEFEESYAALMRAMESIRTLATVLPNKDSVRAFTRQPFMSRMSIQIMQLKRKLNVS